MPVDESILRRNSPPAPTLPPRRGMNPWVVGVGGSVLEVLFFAAGLTDPSAGRVFLVVMALGVAGFYGAMKYGAWQRGGLIGAHEEFDHPFVSALEGEPRPTAMRNAVVWLIVLAVLLSMALVALNPRVLVVGSGRRGGGAPRASGP